MLLKTFETCDFKYRIPFCTCGYKNFSFIIKKHKFLTYGIRSELEILILTDFLL